MNSPDDLVADLDRLTELLALGASGRPDPEHVAGVLNRWRALQAHLRGGGHLPYVWASQRPMRALLREEATSVTHRVGGGAVVAAEAMCPSGCPGDYLERHGGRHLPGCAGAPAGEPQAATP